MGTKIKSSEISVTTANTVFESKNVRVFAANSALVTVRDSSNNVIGTMTYPAGTIEVIEKSPTDTISANVAVLCVAIGYN